MPKIIDEQVQAGREAFDNGTSLRSVIEKVMAADVSGEDHEDDVMSFVIGFADALLDRLRVPLVAVKAGAGGE